MTDFKWPDQSLDLQWTGSHGIPRVGDRVMTYLNGLGAGVVTGYFVEHGYLGVKVKLESPPDWYLAQNTTGGVAYMFGLDLEPVRKK